MSQPSTASVSPRETVFLLHGQGRTRASMALLGLRLRRSGYRTVSFGYRSRRRSLSDITAELQRRIEERNDEAPYHLVGHSLGNVIIRDGFRSGYPAGLEHIVMLAPPNHAAELARRFGSRRIYRWLTGEVGQLLGDEAFFAELPTPSVPFGVIAGDRDHTGLLDERNDGVVTVERTKLDGMTDFAVVPHTHTFMMTTRNVFELVERFLRTGRFTVGS